MDSTNSYRPQSPDLSTYAPQSPDLSGLGSAAQPAFSHNTFPGLSTPAFGGYPTSQPAYHIEQAHQDSFGANQYSLPSGGYPLPQVSQFPHSQQQLQTQPQHVFNMAPGQQFHPGNDAEYQPHGRSTRSRRGQFPLQQQPQLQQQIPLQAQPPPPPQPPPHHFDAHAFGHQPNQFMAPMQGIVEAAPVDPTHGVVLKTSFPVARIKRIMQADEDIGKVAQVTPHVVSRALELFMIKLITASATQAQGGAGGKGQKRIMSQHLKRVIMTDDSFDFLREIADKVPDAPAKGKKEANSDSDEAKPGKRKGKKRKDSGDDF